MIDRTVRLALLALTGAIVAEATIGWQLPGLSTDAHARLNIFETVLGLMAFMLVLALAPEEPREP